jgi:hypothetical protein
MEGIEDGKETADFADSAVGFASAADEKFVLLLSVTSAAEAKPTAQSAVLPLVFWVAVRLCHAADYITSVRDEGGAPRLGV